MFQVRVARRSGVIFVFKRCQRRAGGRGDYHRHRFQTANFAQIKVTELNIVFLFRLDWCFASTCASATAIMCGEATAQLMSHGLGMGAQAILNRLKRELKIKNEILMNAS